MKVRWRIAVAGVTAAGLLGLVTAGAIFSNATLRVQRKAPVLATGLKGGVLRNVSIQASDGVRLDAWFVASNQPLNRCVIVLHGIADSRAGSIGFAPMFLEGGYSVLAPDSRAHGSSSGELVTYGLLEKYDVADWAAWLRGEGCSSIYGLGESLGAATLIQACSVSDLFRAAVAESSYADLRSIGEYRAGGATGRVLVGAGLLFARLRHGLDLEQASPLAAIARTRTPILLIHGAEDRETPPSHSKKLAAANPTAELWIVRGAGHTGAAAADPSGFNRRVLDWFAKH